MAHTACLVCLISTVSGYNKKERKKAQNGLEDVALVVGTLQNLSNIDVDTQLAPPIRGAKLVICLYTDRQLKSWKILENNEK